MGFGKAIIAAMIVLFIIIAAIVVYVIVKQKKGLMGLSFLAPNLLGDENVELAPLDAIEYAKWFADASASSQKIMSAVTFVFNNNKPMLTAKSVDEINGANSTNVIQDYLVQKCELLLQMPSRSLSLLRDGNVSAAQALRESFESLISTVRAFVLSVSKAIKEKGNELPRMCTPWIAGAPLTHAKISATGGCNALTSRGVNMTFLNVPRAGAISAANYLWNTIP